MWQTDTRSPPSAPRQLPWSTHRTPCPLPPLRFGRRSAPCAHGLSVCRAPRRARQPCCGGPAAPRGGQRATQNAQAPRCARIAPRRTGGGQPAAAAGRPSSLAGGPASGGRWHSGERSLRAKAAPRYSACWKARPRPAPVMASTLPTASPTRATVSRVTRASRRVPVTAPRTAVVGAAPSNAPATCGNQAKRCGKRARLGGQQTHAHLLRTHGRDIRLPIPVPVDLGNADQVRHPIVALKAETWTGDDALVETHPPAHG